MAVSDMVKQGHKEIQQTDDVLKRSQKIVEDTIQVSVLRAWLLVTSAIRNHEKIVLDCMLSCKRSRLPVWRRQDV